MSFSVLLFMCCYMGYIWSIYTFCEKCLNGLKINKMIFIILLFCGEVFADVIIAWFNMPYIFKAILNHIVFFSFLLAFFKEDMKKKLLVAAILLTIKILVWNFGGSFLSCLVLIGTNIATNGEIISIRLGIDYLISGAAYLMVILVINRCRKTVTSVFENKVKNGYLMLSIPLILIVIIIDVVNWGASNGIMVVSNVNGAKYWNIYHNQIFSHIAICILTGLSMCIAGGLIFGMNKIYMEQRQKEQYYSLIAFYKMLNEQYLQMERLRHDMKNHVLSLYGLWESGEVKKIGSYLEKMMENGSIRTNDEVTGSKVIDALLYNKHQQAEQNKILWECDVQIPKDCNMDEFDLCVLFGNILDNALNACAESQDATYRFVRVVSQKVKGCFLLTVENGTKMEDIKEMKQGIGFLNIHETVKKYNGTISTKVENHVFEISVLLPMEL